MKIKVNNKHFVEIHNIVKLVEKKNPKCYTCTKTWVYLKEGYPKILKTNGRKISFLRKLEKLGCPRKKLEELNNNIN